MSDKPLSSTSALRRGLLAVGWIATALLTSAITCEEIERRTEAVDPMYQEDEVDVMAADEVFELGFRVNGNSVRVSLACQLRRIPAAIDVGNLGGGEPHHLKVGVTPVEDVEVVEVAPGGAKDQYTSRHGRHSGTATRRAAGEGG